jgi:hypothetical protein
MIKFEITAATFNGNVVKAVGETQSAARDAVKVAAANLGSCIRKVISIKAA